MVGVAQLVRVPDCDSGCRGFESHRSPRFSFRGLRNEDWDICLRCRDFPQSLALDSQSLKNGPLAQLVEQLTLNQRVGGSTPPRPTIIAAGPAPEGAGPAGVSDVRISARPFRSFSRMGGAGECGGTGRRAGFRFQWGNPWEFESLHSHQTERMDVHLLSLSRAGGRGMG